jgi:sugar (pentulose or hexulose) kinase
MDAETWMDANTALQYGFIDGILARETQPAAVVIETKDEDPATPDTTNKTENSAAAPKTSMLFSRKAVECALVNKLRHRMIADAAKTMGWPVDKNSLYATLFSKALEGKPDCDGIIAFNYFAGEPLTATPTGRPMLVRLPDSKMDIANFMRSQLYGAIATLKIGMDMLAREESVESDKLLGHGGYFKTPGVGQQILADALNVPISTMETAGEGGPWGMALLAAFMERKTPGETMEDYLQNRVFAKANSTTLNPDPAGVAGFESYMERFTACLDAQRAAAVMN